jgi:hypothetical protein
MEAANTSEMSVNFYQTTRRNNPEEVIFTRMVNVQFRRFLCYAVPHNCYTLLLENIRLYFVQQAFFLRFFLNFFLHPVPYSLLLLNVTVGYSITVFLQRLKTIKPATS